MCSAVFLALITLVPSVASLPPAAQPPPPPSGGTGSGSATSSGDVSSGVDPALIPLPIPQTVPAMLDQLRARTSQIGALIEKGLFADVYVPAFQAKDVALALEAHEKELPLDILDCLCRFHHAKKTREGWAFVDGVGKRAFVAPDDPRHPRHRPAA